MCSADACLLMLVLGERGPDCQSPQDTIGSQVALLYKMLARPSKAVHPHRGKIGCLTLATALICAISVVPISAHSGKFTDASVLAASGPHQVARGLPIVTRTMDSKFVNRTVFSRLATQLFVGLSLDQSQTVLLLGRASRHLCVRRLIPANSSAAHTITSTLRVILSSYSLDKGRTLHSVPATREPHLSLTRPRTFSSISPMVAKLS